MPDKQNRPIYLPEHVIQDIANLFKHRKHISLIIEAAAQAEPTALVSQFFQAVAKKTGVPTRAVRNVIFILWNLSRVRGGGERSPDELAKAITEALEQNADEEWQAQYLQVWKDASPEIATAFKTLTDDHPYSISQKAQSLAFVHQNVLTAARLITDVRPVFDTAGERILETVIIHTLSIQYSSGQNPPSTIDFALDADDVESLLRACQRAETKMQTARVALKDLNPIVFPQ